LLWFDDVYPRRLAEYRRALEVGREAEALARAAGDTQSLAEILFKLGAVHLDQGNFGRALEIFGEARPLFEQTGDSLGLADVLSRAAICHGERADYPRALEFFLLARRAYEKGGDAINVSRQSLNIGRVYQVLGQADREATDGPQALAAVDDQIHLVLLDVMMPQMSGFEVCRRLRERFPMSRLPVVFVTAKDRPEDLAKGFAAGGTDYLTKPVSMDDLLTRVEAHLRRTDPPRG
jgi:CheY-like chemotaxis protein